ncbi:metal ABC transporter ATP-binding protein [Thermosulfurimonas marina]|uniref:Metal ABC transporter ATP-binding protein n=1 Tax=Thermosulfurimonas marina TaxID=2047767 RepID=A0A6H1WR62_9BACT|nr:metal ABC transporter ATP-binding protein [Thermosulfurimonas marina]QJA05707.1 metal ABC transporter ATP-binding protein [Thermosulfurimonas marina]
MTPVVEAEKVSFAYDGEPVLEEVTLKLFLGDFCALIGPNGSGKSTLLKILVGLLRPQEGRVRLFGKDLEEFREWHRVGYVPQKVTALVDRVLPLTVAEAVALGLVARRGLSAKERRLRVARALERVGLSGMEGRLLRELSGGQQQRVFLARALVGEPELLLLDEPTTGVDFASQERFYELLGNLNREGITILIVTHDIGVVDRHVKQVACLNRRLVFHGDHLEFCRHPEVCGFTGAGHHLVGHRH